MEMDEEAKIRKDLEEMNKWD